MRGYGFGLSSFLEAGDGVLGDAFFALDPRAATLEIGPTNILNTAASAVW